MTSPRPFQVPTTLPLPCMRAEAFKEIEEKLPRLDALMDQEGVQGVLLSRVANFSWITAGLGDSHIVITSELGAVDLLLLRDGRRFAIANGSEIPRMMAEDLKDLGYQPREFPWYEASGGERVVAELAGGLSLGSDCPRAGMKNLESSLAAARVPLTGHEIAKYRWLGQETARAVEEVCRHLRPGTSERQMEALTSDCSMARGIRPTVLLMGCDQRIHDFRHATPTDQTVLESYGMVNVCARRWGLVAAATRFLHFGPVPAELQSKLGVAAKVNATLQHASRAGVSSAELLATAKQAYAANGYPEEWKQHHQGGAIGYGERDWVISPGGLEKVRDRQAFAFNPTVQGAKVEDTVLLLDGAIENLTRTGQWPEITTTIDSQTYTSPAILELAR